MKEIKRTGAGLQIDVFCVDTLPACKVFLPALESYSLERVYEGLIRRKPASSHEAEADCFNLLHLMAKMEKEEWIPWVEEIMVKFDTIQPMRF